MAEEEIANALTYLQDPMRLKRSLLTLLEEDAIQYDGIRYHSVVDRERVMQTGKLRRDMRPDESIKEKV